MWPQPVQHSSASPPSPAPVKDLKFIKNLPLQDIQTSGCAIWVRWQLLNGVLWIQCSNLWWDIPEYSNVSLSHGQSCNYKWAAASAKNWDCSELYYYKSTLSYLFYLYFNWVISFWLYHWAIFYSLVFYEYRLHKSRHFLLVYILQSSYMGILVKSSIFMSSLCQKFLSSLSSWFSIIFCILKNLGLLLSLALRWSLTTEH